MKFIVWVSDQVKAEDALSAIESALSLPFHREIPYSVKLLEQQGVYCVVQEGGTSDELYLHSFDNVEDAEEHRHDCADSGSYRTSPVFSIPADLADHPDILEAAQIIDNAICEIDYP